MAESETGWKLSIAARVEKYGPECVAAATEEYGHTPCADELERFACPYEIIDLGQNLVTTLGSARLIALLSGTGQAFVTNRTVVGVGSSNAAAAAGQTDLQAPAGAANRWFTGADAGYPSVAGNVMTIKATFGPNDANGFVWNEWCYAIAAGTIVPSSVFATATASGIMFNRKVENLGTKPLNDTWIHSSTITGP